jgi:hypothetical protein
MYARAISNSSMRICVQLILLSTADQARVALSIALLSVLKCVWYTCYQLVRCRASL